MMYRKKPVVIEALQWDGSMDGMLEINKHWPLLDTVGTTTNKDTGTVYMWNIRTLEGMQRISAGDYIIKGLKGEFYPCKPDIFDMTYELPVVIQTEPPTQAQPPTAWAHLPNAARIDRILASLAAHPDKWKAAWTETKTATQTATYIEAWDAAYIEARGAARGAAETAARGAARGTARTAARTAAWSASWTAARGAGGSAITALIAWDDCAYMLELPDDTLSELRAVGNQQALLLSAAAKVLKETS